MTKITILGERCSGTNYLEELVKANFNVHLTWECGFKHWFKLRRNIATIAIIRNPIDWLHSLYNSPHNIPDENTKLPGFFIK